MVPKGFKKVKETRILDAYKLPSLPGMNLPESKIVAAEVLDQVLFEKLGFHFLEPSHQEKTVYKVRHLVQGIQASPSMSVLQKMTNKLSQNTSALSRKRSPKSPKKQELKRIKSNLISIQPRSYSPVTPAKRTQTAILH